MGYMRSHAIVVESYDREKLEAAHVFAVRLFPWVSPISPPTTNSIQSFFVPSDGSKEGWPESVAGDALRAEFRSHLRKYQYDDGSTPVKWVEVQFADDDGEVKVIEHG